MVVAQAGEFPVLREIDSVDALALGQDLLQGGQDLFRPGEEGGEIGDSATSVHSVAEHGNGAFVDGVGCFQLVQDPMAGKVQLEERLEKRLDGEQGRGKEIALHPRSQFLAQEKAEAPAGEDDRRGGEVVALAVFQHARPGPLDQVFLEADQLEHGTSSTSARST